jgi:hypothetical protein
MDYIRKIRINNYLLTLFPIILGYFIYIKLNSNFPFYFQFDTDATVTIDNILIQSGLLPDHLQHPSFGMYILQTFTIKILHSVYNILTMLGTIIHVDKYIEQINFAIDFNSMLSCKNKFLCVENTTKILQLFSIIITSITVCFLLVRNKIADNKLLNISLITIFLVLDEGIIYNSLQIKSELYAFLFFIIGYYLLGNKRYLEVAIFAVLTYMTKVSFAYYALYLYLRVMFCQNNDEESEYRNSYYPYILIAILLLAYYHKFSVNFSNFSAFKLNTIQNISILTACISLIVYKINYNKINKYNYLSKINYTNYIYLKAVILVLSIPFFYQFDFEYSYRFSLSGYKFAFLRSFSSFLDIAGFLELLHVRTIELSIYTFGSIFLILFFKEANKNKLFEFLILAICILNLIMMSSRPVYRDIYVAKNLLMINFLYLVTSRLSQMTNLAKTISILVFIFLIFIKSSYPNVVSYLDSENTHYGYNINPWGVGVYSGNHMVYKNQFGKDFDLNGRVEAEKKDKIKFLNSIVKNQSNVKYSYINVNNECLNNIGFPIGKFELIEINGLENNINTIKSRWHLNGPAITNEYYDLARENKGVEFLPREDGRLFIISDTVLETKLSEYYKPGPNKIDFEIFDTFSAESYPKFNCELIINGNKNKYIITLINRHYIMNKNDMKKVFFYIN